MEKPTIRIWKPSNPTYVQKAKSKKTSANDLNLMQLLQAMAYMNEQPVIAVLPFLVFLAMYCLSTRRFVLIVALFWACYVPYEYGMKLRILCSGECNIRVDLLLIYPALAVASVAALVVAIWAIRVNRHSSRNGDRQA